MPNITLKGIPADVHEALKEQAAAHGRSLNREVILRLRMSIVRDRSADPVALLAASRRLQKRMPAVHLDDAFLATAKRQGRA